MRAIVFIYLFIYSFMHLCRITQKLWMDVEEHFHVDMCWAILEAY